MKHQPTPVEKGQNKVIDRLAIKPYITCSGDEEDRDIGVEEDS